MTLRCAVCGWAIIADAAGYIHVYQGRDYDHPATPRKEEAKMKITFALGTAAETVERFVTNGCANLWVKVVCDDGDTYEGEHDLTDSVEQRAVVLLDPDNDERHVIPFAAIDTIEIQ